MHILPTFLYLLVSAASARSDPSAGAGGGALYPPGLLPLITRANTLLATGQFADAIRAYTEAIDQSPADSSLLYKRATAYLSLGRHPPALADFDAVLSLTHGTFDKAYLQSARIHLKDGDWSSARVAAQRYAQRISTTSESGSTSGAGGAGSGESSASDLLFAISEGEVSARKALQMSRAGLYTACMEAAGDAMRVATHSTDLRKLRAECALRAGDVQQHVGDLVRLTSLLPASSPSFLHISSTSYFLLPSSPQALSSLKQCLHFDPDSPPCSRLHKTLRKLDKGFAKVEEMRGRGEWGAVVKYLVGSGSGSGSGDGGDGFLKVFDEAMVEALGGLDLPPPFNLPPAETQTQTTSQKLSSTNFPSPRRLTLLASLCTAYTNLNKPAAGEAWCKSVLGVLDLMGGSSDDNTNPNTNAHEPVKLHLDIENGSTLRADALVGLGEAHLKREEWEEAARVFESAWDAEGRGRGDIHERLQKAQRLLKQARKKDYYKVLGVARDADERTIKKAYRRAAKTAHPDKGGTEAKMAAVNEAYEVLSKPELRQRFDNGDDPNDPMAQQGGHPFQQGTHPFAAFFQQGAGGGFGHGGGGPFGGGKGHAGGGTGGGFQFHFAG
ncbi:hypothetical protein BD410DRAFT_775048 [Rickenella mellea]|uniref:J domain-containing protein n=1 Tax=Rickenella mellea TaxID=50990 RepID=A0A4Y7PUZ0_9AGAM|nr:hypothetical protein BD410DRAFT_775048 [Rickenella mellea]